MNPQYSIMCTCGHRVHVGPDQLGRTWKCAKCNRPILVTIETVDTHRASTNPAATRSRQAENKIPVEWQKGDLYLDLYEVVDYLGRGGMGKVYKVHHRGWDIDLAVKSPRPELLQRAGGAENFERECAMWVNLGLHPYIVSCYYVRRLGDIPRIFAEYVEGGSLLNWIRKEKLYGGEKERNLARILQIAIQVAWGLHYAHEEGLIHRDVKPGNVMLTADGTAKVTDFGLAKVQAGVSDQAESPPRRVVLAPLGMTRAYCSPEQASGKVVSQKTDIWSWGVTVLHMFMGKVTWRAGPEARQALKRYLKKGPGDKRLPRMPSAVAKLLQRCLEVDVAARLNDMLEAGAVLQEIYQETTGNAFPYKPPVLIEARAESLNNRAVSLLDLGKQDEAERSWEEALRVVPNHSESTYNLGLIRWRAARLTDEALLYKLQEVAMLHRGDMLPLRLIAQVHLERGDSRSAVQVLNELKATTAHDEGVRGLVRAATDHVGTSRRLKRTFEGHADTVTTVSLSLDGRFALSGSEDNTVMLWEVSTGRCLHIFKGHTGSVESACISSDGQWAVSGSRDKTLKVWKVATGRCLRTFEDQQDSVRAVALSQSGHVIVFTSADNTVVACKAETGEVMTTCAGHSARVNAVQLSPNGRYALSGSEDATSRFWDMGTGECTRVFEGHSGPITSVAVSGDGRYGLSGSEDNTLKLWDIDAGCCVRTFVGHSEEVSAVTFSPDGRYVLSGAKDTTVRLWDVVTQRCVCTFKSHDGPVTSVALSRDGEWGLSGSQDNTVKLWKVSTNTKPDSAPLVLCRALRTETILDAEKAFKSALDGARRAMRKGDSVAAARRIREARARPGFQRRAEALHKWFQLYARLPKAVLNGAWEGPTCQGHDGPVESVWLSEDGRTAITGGEDATLRLWEVASGRCLRTMEGHGAAVNSVRLSEDGRYAFSGSEDTSVRLWDLQSGVCQRIFEGQMGSVESIALSSNGLYLLSGGWDTKLWEVATGRCLRTLEGHTADVIALTWSCDGRFILSGSSDETLKLWETATGRCLRTLHGHGEPVRSVCLSADGRYAISGSGGLWSKPGQLRLWELASARCLRTFEGHTDAVNSVHLTVDGHFALSGSKDGTLKLWETASGKCVRTFSGHADSVESVVLSRDGRYAISASRDGTVKVWILDWELEDVTPVDWNKGAKPYLLSFLSRHTPYAAALPEDHDLSNNQITRALTHRGRPTWTEDDFKRLLYTLGCAGYGWLKPEGVRRVLDRLATRRRPFFFFSKKFGD